MAAGRCPGNAHPHALATPCHGDHQCESRSGSGSGKRAARNVWGGNADLGKGPSRLATRPDNSKPKRNVADCRSPLEAWWAEVTRHTPTAHLTESHDDRDSRAALRDSRIHHAEHATGIRAHNFEHTTTAADRQTRDGQLRRPRTLPRRLDTPGTPPARAQSPDGDSVAALRRHIPPPAPAPVWTATRRGHRRGQARPTDSLPEPDCAHTRLTPSIPLLKLRMADHPSQAHAAHIHRRRHGGASGVRSVRPCREKVSDDGSGAAVRWRGTLWWVGKSGDGGWEAGGWRWWVGGGARRGQMGSWLEVGTKRGAKW